MDLIDYLINEGWLKTPRIIDAFRKIRRQDFMPQGSEKSAGLNEALPIGFGQTISQPLTVAFMLEQLQPELGEKILDVGSGSGWSTALLAEITGQKGKVIGIEIIPELKEFGKKNAQKYGFVDKKAVEFICGDGSKGYKKEAPFDRVLVSASAKETPKDLKKQLKIGGRMVIPIGNSIWVLIKKSEKKFQEKEFPGFAFVPLILTPRQKK